MHPAIPTRYRGGFVSKLLRSGGEGKGMSVLDRLVALGIFCLASQRPLEVRESYPERVSIRQISGNFKDIVCTQMSLPLDDAYERVQV